jgi:hypothetical protein
MKRLAITGSQIAAARAFTEMSQAKLAGRAQVEQSVVAELEARRNSPNDPSAELSRIRLVLEQMGAVFLDEHGGAGAGVRLKFGRSQTRAIDRWEDEGGPASEDDVP